MKCGLNRNGNCPGDGPQEMVQMRVTRGLPSRKSSIRKGGVVEPFDELRDTE